MTRGRVYLAEHEVFKADRVRAARNAAAWMALAGPGMLVSSGVVTLVLVGMPWLTTAVYIAPVVRQTATALLVAQTTVSGLLLWQPQWAWLGHTFRLLLSVAAVACGVLMGADPQLLSPAGPIAVIVLAMGFEADGWRGLARGAFCAAVAATFAPWCGAVRPLLLVPAPSFRSALSVDTTFAGVHLFGEPFVGLVGASGGGGVTFPTTLSVETFFGNVPVLGTSRTLFAPALVVVVCALWAGMVVNLWRTRRARAPMVATGRLAW